MFIAQLIEHRTSNAEIMDSNPVEVLNFFRLVSITKTRKNTQKQKQKETQKDMEDELAIEKPYCLVKHGLKSFWRQGDKRCLLRFDLKVPFNDARKRKCEHTIQRPTVATRQRF